MMPVKYRSINAVTIGYLGSLDDESLIVVIGRNNYKKSSELLDSLLHDLHKFGYSICWFENQHTQTSKLLDDRFERSCDSNISNFCQRNPIIGNLIRKFIKVLILLMHPMRWGYFLAILKNSNQILAKDLRKLLRKLPSKKIFLFSHSAGGIVSSLVESEKNVAKLVCFGYPFKHPEHEEERIRTAHLETITKPFLIIQGDQDEYGSAMDSHRYALAPSISVIPIQADHGYDNLSPVTYQRCLELLHMFYK